MIAPETIRKKALRIYHRRLLAAALPGAPESDADMFPLEIPADLGRTTEAYAKRFADLEQLLSKEKSRLGFGYCVEMKTVKTRLQGLQSIPGRIYFETIGDFLRFIQKTDEFNAFKTNAAILIAAFPQLAAWAPAHTGDIVAYRQDWPNLLSVCRYLVDNPRPDFYIRELPIEVPTKFIESHTRILKSLLDFLLPENTIDKEAFDFEKRYGLKSKPLCIRFRLLDEPFFSQAFPSGITDIAVTVHEFRKINLPSRNIFIVENEMNFLTFPLINQSIVIWGKGFAVESLKETPWLQGKKLYYWGDIDPHGFAILSMLRKYFPGTTSIMMDRATYTRFQDLAVAGTIFVKETPKYLTSHEKDLFTLLQENPQQNRLEQEKIPHRYAKEALDRISADTPQTNP